MEVHKVPFLNKFGTPETDFETMDPIASTNPIILDGNLKVHDELNIDLLKEKIAADEGPGGERKRTVSGTKSANTKTAVMWPEFKIPVPDPELGKYQFIDFIASLLHVICHNFLSKVSPEKFSLAKEA